jgi:hypothetical protein
MPMETHKIRLIKTNEKNNAIYFKEIIFTRQVLNVKTKKTRYRRHLHYRKKKKKL